MASSFGAGAAMFVMIGSTKSPPPPSPPIFFSDPAGEIHSLGQYGDVIATDAAALNKANEAPPLADGATCALVDTGLQATYMR